MNQSRWLLIDLGFGKTLGRRDVVRESNLRQFVLHVGLLQFLPGDHYRDRGLGD